MTHALQVYLDEPDYQALVAWARQSDLTLSQAVRLALRALTRPPSSDPLLSASGMIEGLPADLTERFDQYLNNTYVAEPLARYETSKPKRRPRKTVRR